MVEENCGGLHGTTYCDVVERAGLKMVGREWELGREWWMVGATITGVVCRYAH